MVECVEKLLKALVSGVLKKNLIVEFFIDNFTHFILEFYHFRNVL